MFTNDELHYRIMHLIPDAKFSFWPDDGVRDNTEMGNELPLIKIEGWVINWYKENSAACPSEDELKKIDEILMMQKVNNGLKHARNMNKADDLSLVAAYSAEKNVKPFLEFSDYLDELEVTAQAIKSAESKKL